MKQPIKLSGSWERRETTAAGPGDNTSHAKARKVAKRIGTKTHRKALKNQLRQEMT